MQASQNSRGKHRAAILITALLALGSLSSGCALVEGPTPQTPPRVTPAVPEVAPKMVPGGSAEENLPYFTEVIRTFAAGTQPVEGIPVSTAVIDAGFDVAAMQLSFDRTQTGLVADSIFVSVRIGESCLIGQVVTADRSFVTQLEPVVGPNKDLCLIGNTRQISW